MLVPTRGIAADRALLTIGAEVSEVLDRPLTVTQAWSQLRRRRSGGDFESELPFWWFALALDVLFALGVVELQGTLLVKSETAQGAADN
jgi:hypothetical protein